MKTEQWISVISQVWATRSGHSLSGRVLQSGRPPGIWYVSSFLIMQTETVFFCHYNNIQLGTGFRTWRKRCKEVLWASPRCSWYVYLKRADTYLKRGFRAFGFHCFSQLLFLVGLDKSTLSSVSSLICKERAKYLLFSLTSRFCMFLSPSCLAAGLALLM